MTKYRLPRHQISTRSIASAPLASSCRRARLCTLCASAAPIRRGRRDYRSSMFWPAALTILTTCYSSYAAMIDVSGHYLLFDHSAAGYFRFLCVDQEMAGNQKLPPSSSGPFPIGGTPRRQAKHMNASRRGQLSCVGGLSNKFILECVGMPPSTSPHRVMAAGKHNNVPR